MKKLNPISIVAKVTTLPHLAFAMLPVLGFLLGGGIFHWITLFVYLTLALVDPWVGEDSTNHDPADEQYLEGRFFYRAMLWVIVPVCLGLTIFAHWVLTQTPLSASETIGFLLSIMLSGAFLSTVAHELCHHSQRFDRFLGDLIFMPLFMCDFHVYHNFVHHTHAATPNDPGTAKYGESVYSFMWNSTIQKSKAAWDVESLRMKRKGLVVWHPSNLMVRFIVLQSAWLIFLVSLFGLWSIPICAAQYFMSRLSLAVSDYLEHYGLGRKQSANGMYEQTAPQHAWDDCAAVSSMLYCQIDRHSDHHTNVGRPYQILRVMEDAPRLPYGYLTMVPMALTPPLWRRRMHPIVEAFYDKGTVVPYAVRGTLPDKYQAMVPVGWGRPIQNKGPDDLSLDAANNEINPM